MARSIFGELDEIMADAEEATLIGDETEESIIFLSALESQCTPQEFADLMEESAVEMGLYGLIGDASVAEEATKNIVKMNKQATFSKIEKRAAIRLAKKANDPAYSKYAVARKKMLDNRAIIYQKYGTKARAEAKKIIANERRKASAMNSAAGRTIVDKMDSAIAGANKNVTKVAATKKNTSKK